MIFASWFRLAAERLRDLVEGAYPSVGHAGEFETSVMLALRPELVEMSRAQDDGLPPQAPQLRGDLLAGPSAYRALPFDKLTKHGVFGRPTQASEAKGRRILERTTAALRELVEASWPDGPHLQEKP